MPSVKAQEVAGSLVDAGIEGILCFSPVNLNLPRHVVVQYVDLTSELQTLLYFMKEEENQGETMTKTNYRNHCQCKA